MTSDVLDEGMVAILVELLGGPECGAWVEVAYIGHGLLVVRGHRYLWETDGDGSRFLRYVGEVA